MNSKMLMLNQKLLKKEAGFSLIELLIAMLIGLFLLVGISSSYVASKKSSISRDQYSTLEDNGRLALEVMSKTIQHTGYTSTTVAVLENKIIMGGVSSNGCTGGGQSVVNTAIFPANSTLDNVFGDSIGVVYLGDNDVTTDCSGGVIHNNCKYNPASPSATTGYANIYSSFFLDFASHELKCAGSRRNDIEIIAEGIENIQILYGVDANDDGNNVVDRYVNATDLGMLGNRVVSVQIAVLVRSQREIKDQSESVTYTLLDIPYTTPNDRFLRAVFSTTINLRNTL